MAVPALALFYGGLVRTKNMLSVLMIAAITCCLILGALVERGKFSGALLFLVLWFTFSYLPVAHMVWFCAAPDAYTCPANADAVKATAGLLWQSGALAFAGGPMVHVNAEVAGLLGALVLGKRIGFGHRRRVPAGVTGLRGADHRHRQAVRRHRVKSSTG